MCKIKPHTSCKNTVYGLLYGNNIQAKTMDYGRNLGQYAINEFETKFGFLQLVYVWNTLFSCEPR